MNTARECVVLGCKNSYVADCEVRFFSVPTTGSKVYPRWTKLMTLSGDRHEKICDRHFVESDFTENTRCKLKKNAVPNVKVSLGVERKAGNRCCIAQCKPRKRKTALHHFPTERQIRNKWKAAVGLKDPDDPTGLRICNRHFKTSDFNQVTSRYLKCGAVPSKGFSSLAEDSKHRSNELNRPDHLEDHSYSTYLTLHKFSVRQHSRGGPSSNQNSSLRISGTARDLCNTTESSETSESEIQEDGENFGESSQPIDIFKYLGLTSQVLPCKRSPIRPNEDSNSDYSVKSLYTETRNQLQSASDDSDSDYRIESLNATTMKRKIQTKTVSDNAAVEPVTSSESASEANVRRKRKAPVPLKSTSTTSHDSQEDEADLYESDSDPLSDIEPHIAQSALDTSMSDTMPPPCTVPGCENPCPLWTAQFPQNSELRQRWLDAIQAGTGQQLTLEPIPVVCNLHFSDQSLSVGSYREPTIFQSATSDTFISSCLMCHSFGKSEKMFHFNQCLLPGQTLRMIADKHFKLFESTADDSVQDGFFCEGCTVRLDVVHSIWLNVNRGMAQYASLLQKMSREKVLPFSEHPRAEQETVVKKELQLEEMESDPVDIDSNDTTEPHLPGKDADLDSSESSAVDDHSDPPRSSQMPTLNLRLKGVTEDIMQSAVSRVMEGGVLRQVATEYGLSHQTLYRYVRKRKSFQEESTLLRPNHVNYNQVFTKEQEADLAEYVIHVINLLYGLSYRCLRKIAFQYAQLKSIQYPSKWDIEQMTGMGWVVGFMKRNPQISKNTPENCGITKSGAPYHSSHIGLSFSALEKTYKICPDIAAGSRLFLMGEATTFKRSQPTYFIHIPVKVFAIANPSGKRIPPIVVFPNTHKPSYKVAPCGILCLTSSTGTITQELFREIMRHLCEHTSTSAQSPSLLVCDNHEDWIASPTTIDTSRTSGLHLVTIPRHYSKTTQAQSGSIFSVLHSAYKNRSESWLRSNAGQEPTTELVVQWVDEVYSMEFCKLRAEETFRKIGLFPLKRPDDSVAS